MSLFEGKLFVSADAPPRSRSRPSPYRRTASARHPPPGRRRGQGHLYATPGQEGDLWLGATSGLYHSADGGTTFTRIEGVSELRAWVSAKRARASQPRCT